MGFETPPDFEEYGPRPEPLQDTPEAEQGYPTEPVGDENLELAADMTPDDEYDPDISVDSDDAAYEQQQEALQTPSPELGPNRNPPQEAAADQEQPKTPEAVHPIISGLLAAHDTVAARGAELRDLRAAGASEADMAAAHSNLRASIIAVAQATDRYFKYAEDHPDSEVAKWDAIRQ